MNFCQSCYFILYAQGGGGGVGVGAQGLEEDWHPLLCLHLSLMDHVLHILWGGSLTAGVSGEEQSCCT